MLRGEGILIRQVEAVEYVRQVGGGKTDPSIVVAEAPDGSSVEVVLKLASACERGAAALAAELIAACLAGSLGLPIQEPLIVSLSPEWKASLPLGIRGRFAQNDLAFGSKLLFPQWPTWAVQNRLTAPMVQTAASVFAFDSMIENHDRREGNSNCLVRGEELRIIDHELAWVTLLFAKKPWELGCLKGIGENGTHIFHRELLARAFDRHAIERAWTGLHDDDIIAYGHAVPPQWRVGNVVDDILRKIRDARDNVAGCLNEVERVLA